MLNKLLIRIAILAAILAFAGPLPAQQNSCGLSPQLYKERRELLMQSLGDSSALILFSAPVRLREWDTEYEYHQDSNFLYLTGIDKANCALLLIPPGLEVDGRRVREIVFLPERNPMAERWLGERISLEAAKGGLGFQEALLNSSVSEYIDKALQKVKIAYLPNYDPAFVHDPVSNQRFWIERDALKSLRQKYPQLKIKKAATPITEMRTIKSPEELALMQQAIDVTCASLREAIAKVQPGMYEYELEALIEYGFKRHGAEDVSFPSIIGSGPNSIRPHYWENRRKMLDGEVVVLDVGADFCNYAADITRTIPINGKFSPAQREIYDIVYRAQEAAIQAVKPGVKSSEIQAAAKKVIEDAGYGKFLIHGVSHGLGIDTHDPGNYELLRPGMVITIEPGIYIPENTEGLDRKYWNIGIRIEDDVLVTESGCKILSSGMPRALAEIENLMAGK
ncbi:MAG: aminopeptidase P N-terminal domain-containing protein [candidate division KSB1 bacterium]|nr:aminopeptidase P N-terminal domain-containing protein [candidate division KSB1 bacterium]MDZ7302732.1 aminopeptidase P N-terminal domain-containing protein [candidate division KSB1 bacterium]MDZ7310098.1 aminopeptidase P N-terminal domain-containing protein [candidate division KSB1 bacterium]